MGKIGGTAYWCMQFVVCEKIVGSSPSSPAQGRMSDWQGVYNLVIFVGDALGGRQVCKTCRVGSTPTSNSKI